MPFAPLQYKLWKDRGDNVGVECTICHRTHWNEQAPATHPVTQQPCANCQGIKDSGLLASENSKHRMEKESDACLHQPSQPL